MEHPSISTIADLTTDAVRVGQSGEIVMVSVTQPASKNVQSPNVLRGLHQALSAIASWDCPPRVLILSADGDGLFIGKAQTEFLIQATEDQGVWASRLGQENARLLDRMPVVTIAAVDGEARGGGLEMAMACDFIFASSRSSFVQSEARSGVVPGFGGTFRLPRHVGSSRARYMAYRGLPIDAQTALAWGMVIDVVPPENLMSRVLQAAREVCDAQPACVRLIKRLLSEFAEEGLDVSNMIERQAFGETMGRDELELGMRKQVPDLFGSDTPHKIYKRV